MKKGLACIGHLTGSAEAKPRGVDSWSSRVFSLAESSNCFSWTFLGSCLTHASPHLHLWVHVP